MVGGTDLAPGTVPLWPTVEGIDPTLRGSPTSVNIGSRANQERYIAIPQQTEIRPKVVGTRRTNILMAVGYNKHGTDWWLHSLGI